MSSLPVRKIFFHGNFEGTQNWSYLGSDWELFSLWEFLHEEGALARDWSEFSQALIAKIKKTNCTLDFEIAGYSLGGRICLNLLAENAISRELKIRRATLISTHPGLEESQRALRLENDLKWKEKVLSSDWSSLYEEWNKQDLFQEEEADFASFALLEPWRLEIARAFDFLSLARMPQFLGHPERLGSKVSLQWVCGERDQKFLSLAQAFSQKRNVALHVLESVGHRIHKDKNKLILNILSDKL